MKSIIIPPKYQSRLNFYDTETAIKLVKDTFESKLAKALNLIRVSAPLFVDPQTGLNDDLGEGQKAVSFTYHEKRKNLEVVQSLAKWKRNSLLKYNFDGIYTDMNAIRPYEKTDNLHSLYVDQWDWEKRLDKKDRNEKYLQKIVKKIFVALKETEKTISQAYPCLPARLPDEIYFVTSEELENMYPDMTPQERENTITQKWGAVFLMHIGGALPSGHPHDSRAADYDDWNLNGDILLYHDILDMAFEVTSMGIRVDSEALKRQLKIKNEEYKLEMAYHQDIINEVLPLSIGGGIGQSRMCMYMLQKAHIGEVQASYWPPEEIKLLADNNIFLL